MAVGVPENDVFAAADAVLARGERPTVERVRLHLGRGSPARVGGLLDQWWARLAERLNGASRLPTLPIEVAEEFVAVWQQSIYLAQGVAEQALTEQRQVSDQHPDHHLGQQVGTAFHGSISDCHHPWSCIARLDRGQYGDH